MPDEEKTTKIKKRYMFVIVTIAIALVSIVFAMHASKFESTEDAYIETHPVAVSSKVSGQIIKMYVEDNQKVKEGDLVAEIDSTDYQAKVEEKKASYDASLLRQKEAMAIHKAAKTQEELAKKNLDRYTELFKSGAVSSLEYDNAKTNYENTKANLTKASENLLSNEKNRAADADLKKLEALKKQAELNLSYTKVYAPQDGSVTNKTIEKGAYVQTGQPLFTIVPEKIWIVANFKESQLRHMKVGQSVEIKVDTYPDKKFEGKIDSVQRISGAKSSLFPPENAVGSFVKIVQRIPVKIVFTEEINPNEYTIVPGMSVEPKVRVK